MEKIKLSIIIPVYQVATYLESCLESILHQLPGSSEILLIDDGSTDGSGRICDSYGERYPMIQVIHQENQGLSEARNVGIKLAQGEYITFVDSDDTIQPNTFEMLLQKLREDTSIDLLEYPVQQIRDGETSTYLWKEAEVSYRQPDLLVQWLQNKGYNHAYAWNKIYHRSLFDQVRFPPKRHYEDLYTMPMLIERCAHYHISKQGCYYYYQREGSISRTQTFKNCFDLFDSYYQIYQLCCRKQLKGEANLLALQLADWLIDMTRCDRTKTKKILNSIHIDFPTFREIGKLPIPLKRKLKNFFLAIGGYRIHVLTYLSYL